MCLEYYTETHDNNINKTFYYGFYFWYVKLY